MKKLCIAVILAAQNGGRLSENDGENMRMGGIEISGGVFRHKIISGYQQLWEKRRSISFSSRENRLSISLGVDKR